MLPFLNNTNGKNADTVITPQEARRIMTETKEYILLDVRMPDEYRQVRIDGAKLIPVNELPERAPFELTDKQAQILVYCHSGARAEKAVNLLRQMGYENVSSFGGIMNWPYDKINGKEGII